LYNIQALLMHVEVELRKQIGAAIPMFVTLLNGNDDGIRSDTVSALTKLAAHSEFVVVHYSDAANAGMKSSFARTLGQPFQPSSLC